MRVDERIEKLRKLMKERGIAGYIIADSDPHMGEYVSEHWRMRKWISGFTGSAGVVAITHSASGLWTDGRYYIQAERELAGSGIKLFRSGESGVPSYTKWLADNLSEGDKIGICGLYSSLKEVRDLKAYLEKKGIQVVTEYDLVSDIWENRPPIPHEPVFIHAKKYTGYSAKEKLDIVRSKLREKKASYYLIASLDDIAWLYNIRGNDIPYNPVTISYAFISQDDAKLFIDPSKVSKDVADELKGNGIDIEEYISIEDRLPELIDSCGSVYIDPNKMNFRLYSILKNIGCNIIEGRNITTDLKAVKNEVEVANLKETLVKDGVAMVKFLYWLDMNVASEKITELDAARKVDELRSEQEGNRGASFNSISAYGANAAMMHYAPTEDINSTLEEKGMYLLDSGGQYLGGTTDITRTVILGPISDRERRDFTLVLKGHIALAKIKFLYGATGSNLDVLARQPIWEYGIDYKCGTGHGVGYFLNVHEGPQNLSQRVNNVVLKAGMIVTNEPGIYIEGKYGIRTENMMLVVEDELTDSGQFMRFEPITYCPIDIDGIDVSLLNEEEREWLNSYHSRVYKKLSPYLNDEEKNWLRRATREI